MYQSEIQIGKVYEQHSGLKRKVLMMPECGPECSAYKQCRGMQVNARCVSYIHLNGPYIGNRTAMTLRKFAQWAKAESPDAA